MGDTAEVCRRYRAAARGVIVKLINEWLAARPGVRVALLTVYYLGIIAALIALYGRGDFSTPAFVYQEF